MLSVRDSGVPAEHDEPADSRERGRHQSAGFGITAFDR